MPGVSIREALWCPPATTRSLFYQLYQPVESRGLVILLHGFAEHSGRYHGMASALAERSWSVACLDWWGHGRSGGSRGDIGRFAQYFEDLDALITHVFLPVTTHQRYTLFGHSFGGLLALVRAIRGGPSCQNLIVQSPLLGIGYPVPRWKTSLARGLANVWPRFGLPLGLDPGWLSHDPLVVQRYRTDPLVHHRMTARTYVALQAVMQQAKAEAHRVTMPTLMLCGSADRLISLASCQEVFERLTCTKRLRVFEGSYHELHFEPVQREALNEMIDWIATHG